MATEKAERKKGTWSPWIHFQWYRKRCNRIHKYYQASKLQEKSTTKIIGPTQNSLAGNKSLPTEPSNLRLYWIKIKNFVFPIRAVLLIILLIYTGISWYECNHPNRSKNKTYFDKGQLISKCLFGFIVWTKISTKNLTNSAPEWVGQNLSNFSLVFWSKRWNQKDILKLTDL